MAASSASFVQKLIAELVGRDESWTSARLHCAWCNDHFDDVRITDVTTTNDVRRWWEKHGKCEYRRPHAGWKD